MKESATAQRLPRNLAKTQPAAFAFLTIPLALVTILILDVVEKEIPGWDPPLIQRLRSLDSPGNDLVLTVITTLGGGLGLLLLLIPLMTLCFLRGQPISALLLAASVLGARAASLSMKIFLHRARPLDPDYHSIVNRMETMLLVGLALLVCSALLWRRYRHFRDIVPSVVMMVVTVVVAVALTFVPPLLGAEHNHSFPSGHAVSSMALALALVLLWPARRSWLLYGVCAAFVLVVGLSRVYFGLHYPSDILGGWCVGVLWFAFLWALIRPWQQARHPKSSSRA